MNGLELITLEEALMALITNTNQEDIYFLYPYHKEFKRVIDYKWDFEKNSSIYSIFNVKFYKVT